MKKLLLLATVLLGLASVSAQESNVLYKMGDAITSAADLTSGKYFIRAHAGAGNGDTNMSRGEAMVYQTDGDGKVFVLSSFYELNAPTSNYAYVWNIEVSEENLPAGATGDRVFTIQNLSTGDFWSVLGDNGPEVDYPAKGNIYKHTSTAKLPNNPECHVPGQYQLVEMPAGYSPENYYGLYKDCTRFFLQLTNAMFHNGNNRVYPFVHNNNTSPIPLGYWGFSDIISTAVQFDLVKAVEVSAVDVTINFPSLNGKSMSGQYSCALGSSLEDAVKAALASLDCGEFTISDVVSTNGATTITEEGQVINVQGQWNRELIPGKVYRMRIRPHLDACGTIRYMLSTGEIETRREGANATLSRLVPERLWYFTVSGEGENKTYTMHTLHDTSKAVKFTKKDNSWSNAKASLEDNGTELDFAALNNGYIAFKIHGTTNGWFNDFGGFGYLSVYPHKPTTDANFNVNNIDDGSKMLLYPLTDDDFNALALFGSDEDIATAKANPTVDNIKPLIDAYNSHNTDAALKRIEYFSGSLVLGHNPGEYSDPSGKFPDAVAELKAVIANSGATEDEKQAAIDAVNSLIDELSPNQITRVVVEPGVFYRFRNKTSNKYISCLSGGVTNGHAAMAMTADGTRSNTIFYLQANNSAENEADVEYTVVAYDNGLVLPRFHGGSGSTESWMPVLNGSTTASAEFKFNNQSGVYYVIHASAQDDANPHRHLHGAGTTVNVSGNATNDDHQWYIERVTELPVTMFNIVTDDNNYTNDGWSSIYSPVALEVPADRLLTAYTGQFDGADYSHSSNINHVLATPIAPNDEGKVIIPGGQTALLFFDGENSDFNINEDPNINESLMDDRKYITYVNLPIVYGGETVSEQAGNIAGHILAHAPEAGKEYYTLHATHSNNFREYGEWMDNYTYVPGFKAHIINDPDGVDVYPIYLVNPNTMAPADDVDLDPANYRVDETLSETGQRKVTIILNTILTPAGEDITHKCELYYKVTPNAGTMRRAVSHDGYNVADHEDGKERSFYAEPGKIDFYVYHPDTDTKSADRAFTINSDGTTVSINSVHSAAAVNVECYDLQGRKLAAPAKGINIVNGHKVIIK